MSLSIVTTADRPDLAALTARWRSEAFFRDSGRPVDDILARDTARLLAKEEGVFAGISAGATVAAALRVAGRAPKGSVLLAMLPDTGERYLSTVLFEGVSEGSDDEWLAEFDPVGAAPAAIEAA